MYVAPGSPALLLNTEKAYRTLSSLNTQAWWEYSQCDFDSIVFLLQSQLLSSVSAVGMCWTTAWFDHFALCPSSSCRSWSNLFIEVKDENSGTPLGFGSHNVTFPVSALHSQTVDVDIQITASFSELAPIIKSQCSANGYVLFSSSGTKEAWWCSVIHHHHHEVAPWPPLLVLFHAYAHNRDSRSMDMVTKFWHHPGWSLLGAHRMWRCSKHMMMRTIQ